MLIQTMQWNSGPLAAPVEGGYTRINDVGTTGRVSMIYYKNLVWAAWQGAGYDEIWYATMNISEVIKDINFGP